MGTYPRTLTIGGDGRHNAPMRDLAGKHLVVERKLDGAHVSIEFEAGAMILRSRNEPITHSPKDQHLHLFKTWSWAMHDQLYELLGERYQMHGEWMHAKHTVFYDALPHYFMEFDVYDKHGQCFLSTNRRRELLRDWHVISVPVVYEGAVDSLDQLASHHGPSPFKTSKWREALAQTAADDQVWLSQSEIFAQTDPSELDEGLYIKHEDQDRVLGRYKLIREDFLATILRNQDPWWKRPFIGNQLMPSADLFSPLR